MLNGMKWSQVERYYLLKAVALRKIPLALLRKSTPKGSALPVFAQHAPGPKYMNSKLDRIIEAGYRTFDTQDLADWGSGQIANDTPALMLTFDDGLRRFQEVTFPHLMERGMKSVIFICAGLTELASGPSSTLQRYALASVLTWDELKSLQDTGLVDVQSHGMWHNMLPINTDISSYISKPPHSIIEAQELLPPSTELERFFTVEGDVRVARRSSRPFFLTTPNQNIAANTHAHESDMLEAKQRIEARLPGTDARAFAFPWWNGTDMARTAAYRAGYTQLHEGARSLRRTANPADFINRPIGRLSFDFIDCLPGKEQRGLYDLMQAKHRGDYGNELD